MLFNSLQSCCHCPGQPFSKENQDNEIHGPGRLTANISSRSWDTEEKERAGIDDVTYSLLGKEVPLHHG